MKNYHVIPAQVRIQQEMMHFCTNSLDSRLRGNDGRYDTNYVILNNMLMPDPIFLERNFQPEALAETADQKAILTELFNADG